MIRGAVLGNWSTSRICSQNFNLRVSFYVFIYLNKTWHWSKFEQDYWYHLQSGFLNYLSDQNWLHKRKTTFLHENLFLISMTVFFLLNCGKSSFWLLKLFQICIISSSSELSQLHKHFFILKNHFLVYSAKKSLL